MGQVLIYNLPEGEKRKRLRVVLMRTGLRARDVTPEEYGHPVGYLAGMEGFESAEPYTGEGFRDEMLVLHDLSAEQFHGLLNGMQALQAPVTYKAVTTEHNLSWTPTRLYRELAAEHAAMQNR